jgi:hypothetical protein
MEFSIETLGLVINQLLERGEGWSCAVLLLGMWSDSGTEYVLARVAAHFARVLLSDTAWLLQLKLVVVDTVYLQTTRVDNS